MKKPKARILSKENLLTTKFMQVNKYSIEVDKHEGGTNTVTRILMERAPSVAVLAYDPKRDEVLMVNEFRPGLMVAGEKPFNNALPGGIIDENETVLEAGAREILEETGQKPRHLQVIHPGAFVSSGGSTESLALVFGVIDTSKSGGVHGAAGETENIKPVPVKAKDFIRHAHTGKLKNMGTCMAAFWFAAHYKELKKLPQAKKGRRKSPKK